ncbi:unnamed protein product [Adineta steineri]|uniref:Uncharacterized protein n=1 Tax=Adineta steineri TaxID=433720 RepID=A0A814CIN7_9BILA|nr:unnamed protein product [Adineta steineri]CAF0940654.1 unnamed protein product [Adineta steineri]CAF1047564.1 unnamed protein product [Adineta steineri]
MLNSNNERQRELLDNNSNTEQISPLSNRFLVAHSSPVLDTTTTDVITRVQDDSFQSSSSTSNSKSSSSTASRSSRLQFLIMQQQHSTMNSPLMYSRCTSLGSLSSYDIRSSCNDSYTSECSSVKPSGLISPSDMPDSPPCEPEILEEEEEEQRQPQTRPNNRTLTMNTTSSQNRTTMMSETVIEKTFIFNQQEFISNRNNNINHNNDDDYDDDDERLDEVIVYSYDTSDINQNHINKSSYDNEILFDDDSYRVFNSETDENDSLIEDNIVNNESFTVPSHENLSVITEESSFTDDINSTDETNSIKILYDLIKKPHWTNKNNLIEHQSSHYSIKQSNHLEENTNTSLSSNPSSLSLDSNNGNETDDEDEYDQEKGRQLIQRLIEETLARRSVPTDYLHSTSCVHCPSNTPMTIATRSVSSSSSSSISTSTKSCTCITNRSSNSIQQPQRSQSSPARPSSTTTDDSKRQTNKQKENTVHHTRTSYLRLRQAQENKRLYQQDKKF